MNKFVALPIILLCLILAVAFESASGAKGGGGGTAGPGLNWEGSLNLIQIGMDTPQPPDGQMTARNYSMCPWNDEDQEAVQANGSLGSGASSQATLCMVADEDCCNPSDYPKFIYGRVYVKPTTNLRVWAELDGPVMLPDGRVVFNTIEAAPAHPVSWTGSGALEEYYFCGPDTVATTAHKQGWQGLAYWPYNSGPDLYGYGMRITYTIHIQNNGKQPARNVNAYFSIAFRDWDITDSYAPWIQRFQDGLIPNCPNYP